MAQEGKRQWIKKNIHIPSFTTIFEESSLDINKKSCPNIEKMLLP